jgi:hypothetical protein
MADSSECPVIADINLLLAEPISSTDFKYPEFSSLHPAENPK